MKSKPNSKITEIQQVPIDSRLGDAEIKYLKKWNIRAADAGRQSPAMPPLKLLATSLMAELFTNLWRGLLL